MRAWWVGAMLMAACAVARAAEVNVAATHPANEPTSRPATRPNPLANPVSAVTYMFELIGKQDFAQLHDVSFERATATELREQCQQVLAALQHGFTVRTLDSASEGNVASVICQFSTARGTPQPPFSIIAVQRFDDWRVCVGALGPSKLTPGERENLAVVVKWRAQRLAELSATTQPAGTPSR